MFLESSLRECKKDVNLKIKNKRFAIVMTGTFLNYRGCFRCQILSSREFQVIVFEFGGRLLRRVGCRIHSHHQLEGYGPLLTTESLKRGVMANAKSFYVHLEVQTPKYDC
jgi:hypothetical protein